MIKELRSISPLIKELKKRSKEKIKPFPEASQIPQSDQDIIRNIQQETVEYNRNNVTRTNAYYFFYERHPEIHWSFLAHMVSRNAGWNMTDLKGEWLPRLLRADQRKVFFQFLERGNWLIFQDAYPQLLLYQESKRRNSNLFYLLPFLRISRFMEAVWNYFWKERDSLTLTVGLIINEQNYIEKRVISNPFYQEQVLASLEFKLQELLNLNQIIFPSLPSTERHSRPTPELFGHTIQHFASLHQRITLGKRLYSVLFGSRKRLLSIQRWARQTAHTASRKDYWPHLFSTVKDSVPGPSYQKRLEHCHLKHPRIRIYSPILDHVWPDVLHQAAEIGDWFSDWKVAEEFLQEDEVHGEIEETYCRTLEKIELAVMAQDALFP